MEQKKKRAYNIELLRCISMFMIIVLHYNNFSMGKAFFYVPPHSKTYYMLYLLESISIVAVNLFILTSGYFMCNNNKRSLRKPLGLYLMVVGYRIGCMVFELISGMKEFDSKELWNTCIPNDWFVNVYIVLYFLSPYINVVLKCLDKQSYHMLLIVLFVLFSLWGTIVDMNSLVGIGFNPLVAWGGDAGYSIMQFCFMYVVGAYIRFWYKGYCFWKEFIVYCIGVAGTYICSLHTMNAWNYNNAFVVISACALFVLFLKLKIERKWMAKLIGIVGASTFGIYLLHTNPLLYNQFWDLFEIPTVMNAGVRYVLPNLILSTVAMYGMCGVIDTVARWLCTPISKLLDKSRLLVNAIVDIE